MDNTHGVTESTQVKICDGSCLLAVGCLSFMIITKYKYNGYYKMLCFPRCARPSSSNVPLYTAPVALLLIRPVVDGQ